MRGATLAVIASMVLAGTAAFAASDEKAPAKPLISCDKVVETYKLNKSVDETSDTLMVDQSRVTECLKAAGITPSENDQ
jgi:hypothetical protein